MTTLVIGARGSIGRAVLEQLLEAGEPVRASVRDPAAADLPPGVPVVALDLTEAATLRPALRGVDRVFLYAPPGRAAAEAFAEAARDAGVGDVVLLSSGSVLLAYAAGNPIAEEHRAVERTLADSGLRLTPIRPLVLATNTINWAPSIRRPGVVRLVRPDSATAPVHERDVAAVAVAALGGTGDPAVTGVLTGPEPLTPRRQVELIAQEIGRPIAVEELSDAEGRAHLRRFLPPRIADATVDLTLAQDRDGDPAATTAVAQVLGRPPAPFADWVRDHAADFR